MGMRIIAPVAASIALLSLAAGCGGGGGDTEGNEGSGPTTAAATLPKAVFIKKADSICSKADEHTEGEFTAYAKENKITNGKVPSSAQYATIAKTILIPALRRQVEEIRALGLPAGDEARIENFLDGVDAAIEKAEEEPAAAAESPRKLLASADKTVAGYGFKVCG